MITVKNARDMDATSCLALQHLYYYLKKFRQDSSRLRHHSPDLGYFKRFRDGGSDRQIKPIHL